MPDYFFFSLQLVKSVDFLEDVEVLLLVAFPKPGAASSILAGGTIFLEEAGQSDIIN